jgi:hypothetical protein
LAALAVVATLGTTSSGRADEIEDGRPPAPRVPGASASEDVIGLDAAAVAKLLGRPGVTRIEGPAQLWQYAGRACVLDIVFYDARAAYAEARDFQGANVATRACLRAHVRANADSGA